MIIRISLAIICCATLALAKYELADDDTLLTFEEGYPQVEVEMGSRIKRQSDAEKHQIESNVEKKLWKAEYERKLLLERTQQIHDTEKKNSAFHADRKQKLKQILEEAKAEKAVLLSSPPAQPQASPPARAHAAPTVPGETTTTESPETTRVNLRVPVKIYPKLKLFFEKYNAVDFELTQEEIELLDNLHNAETTTPTTTTTTTARPPPKYKYMKMDVPESVFHRLWRFMRNYAFTMDGKNEKPEPKLEDTKVEDAVRKFLNEKKEKA